MSITELPRVPGFGAELLRLASSAAAQCGVIRRILERRRRDQDIGERDLASLVALANDLDLARRRIDEAQQHLCWLGVSPDRTPTAPALPLVRTGQGEYIEDVMP